MSDASVMREIAARKWFYDFEFPGGTRTQSYLPEGVSKIHGTRLTMLRNALARVNGGNLQGMTGVDLACHQGYFSMELARLGLSDILSVDARPEHIADCELVARGMGYTNSRTQLADITRIEPAKMGSFDVVLVFGLLYHLENPVGALRVAREMCKRVCVVETQVVPNQIGMVDWGSYQFRRPMVGSFGVIDEVDEVHAPEASITGICLAPSLEALVYIMRRLGFKRVEQIAPPQDGFEQHTGGTRVVVAGYLD
jgi:tRNA (mo5U34)-methyltransferase